LRHDVKERGIDVTLPLADVHLVGRDSHTVSIVDHSDSMRKDDVTGNVGSMYKDDLLSHVCRLSNDSLSRDFVEIQLSNGSTIDVVVSIIVNLANATAIARQLLVVTG
jgi:hypothetical protein